MSPRPHHLLLFGPLVLLLPAVVPTALLAHEMQVQPYLQRAEPDSIYVHWETTGGTESVVEWGPTESLGSVATGEALEGQGGSQHHSVEITGLQPDTRYWYRTVTEDAGSDTHDFITPAEQSSEARIRLVAMSDMQKSGANPDKFREVVEDGVIDFLAQETSADLPAELAMVLIPGDLVVNGWSYDQFADDFFGPGEDLWTHVPVYPVAGNHENDSSYYFDYFNLPPNGSEGYLEHWWYLDQSNVRVIGLDSNGGYRIQAQLDWLDEVLAEACLDQGIDFVFAQLHHPFKSELWTPGESGYTGSVVERLEAFSTECGKPSIHFFGHTHGYSRGQSRDHEHLWVNVATAGGAIDYWGEWPQADYDEFVVTHDDWGFVLVEVEAGDEPGFRLRRVSRGNSNLPFDNEVRDDLTLRIHNEAPSRPEALAPSGKGAEPDELILVASSYSDPDGDGHGASHWQVSSSCDDFSFPVLDRWVQHRNEYFGEDLQADDDLTDEFVSGLDGETDYCWQVRYRDRGLRWSEWSEARAFRTGKSALSNNLLLNPGAEDGTEHWTATEGPIESLSVGECDSVPPHGGSYLFAVGGVCEGESAYGAAFQRVDVSEWSEGIDGERATAWLAGWMRNYGGSDRPEFEIAAFDSAGLELARSARQTGASTTWTEFSDSLDLPAGTRSVDFLLYGTRTAGSDNDSYLDDLALRLAVEPLPRGDDDDDLAADDDDLAADDDDLAADDDDGAFGAAGSNCGGCASSGARAEPVFLLWLLGVLGGVLGRARGCGLWPYSSSASALRATASK